MPHRFVIPNVILASLLFVITMGCGGGSGGGSGILQPATGNVTLLATDSPACDAVSFTVTITGASLTPATGGSSVEVIASSAPVTVNFAARIDFETVLQSSKVPPGTYSKIDLTFMDPHLTVLDTTQVPPQPVEISATMAPLAVTLDLNPALTVTASGSSALLIDFNLLESLQTDAGGQLTGAVVPVLQAGAAAASLESGFGNLELLASIVQSVTGTSTNPAFTGSFTIPRTPASTELLTISVTNTTKIDGINGLGDLVASQTFVAVDAYLDTSDNIVAAELEAEGEESVAESRGAFIGIISSLDRDSSGKTTQFALWVREEAPDFSAVVPQGALLSVTIDSTTQFTITPDGANQANLPFNASSLEPGEPVIVHGQVQAGTAPAVMATTIFLRLQSIVGSLVPSPPPVVGNDGKTGGFGLAPCSSLYGGTPVTAFTFASTEFSGISGGGLSGLNQGPLFMVKGVGLFEQSPLFVNSVGLSPPATALEAKQVRELP